MNSIIIYKRCDKNDGPWYPCDISDVIPDRYYIVSINNGEYIEALCTYDAVHTMYNRTKKVVPVK